MHLYRRRLLSLALVAALTAGAACTSAGSGDVGGSTTTEADGTSTTEADGTTTTTEADAPDDTTTTTEADAPDDIDAQERDDAQDRVERIDLVAEDLPAEWEATPAPDSAESGLLDRCTDLPVDDIVVARHRSDDFMHAPGDGGELRISSTSGYFVDDAAAEDVLGAVATEEFGTCLSDAMFGDSDFEVDGSVRVNPDVPELGDERVALVGDYTITDPDSGDSSFMSLIVMGIRTDQVVTIVPAMAIDTPGDEQLLYGLYDLIVERQEP